MAAVASLLAGGFGIKLLDHLRTIRQDSKSAELAANDQPFQQSLILMSKLEARVEICEGELKECRESHRKCERESGIMQGRLEELSRQVQSNTAAIENKTIPPVSGIGVI